MKNIPVSPTRTHDQPGTQYPIYSSQPSTSSLFIFSIETILDKRQLQSSCKSCETLTEDVRAHATITLSQLHPVLANPLDLPLFSLAASLRPSVMLFSLKGLPVL
jgi:hypothetical protein